MEQPASERVKKLATAITKRLVENAIRVEYTRQDLALVTNADDEDGALNEDEMVQDALNLAMGDDTGCLSDEELTSEHIDVLFVQEELAKLEQNTRARCFHDFVRLLTSAQDDPTTEDGRVAVRCLRAGVIEQGLAGLGSEPCDCGKPDCPYLSE